ncbi:cytochrome P450 [Xylariales sp. PMI_506]|nr:cytochrome P450 [Xylariales sp. PMI_506]
MLRLTDLEPNGYTAAILLIVIISVPLSYFILYPLRLDSAEPPLLKPTIPFIGHLLGLISLSHGYHRRLFQKHKKPIYTLPILGGKLYVINSPELAQSAIRSRTLNFEPYVTEFIRNMTKTSAAAMEIYENPDFFSQWHQIVYSSLTGQHLMGINLATLQTLTKSLNEVPRDGLAVPDIFLWMRDLMTLASTNSLLGDKNPWKYDARLFEAYWNFEGEIVNMMINILPQFTSPSGFKGRNLMQDAMTKYFTAKYDTDDDVPKFTKDRMQLERKFGMEPGDMAGLEVAVLHGSLSNTIPTAYWMLVHVFSKPGLVEMLRTEAASLVKNAGRSGDGQRVMTIDSVRIEEKCPLLFSTLCETQRVISGAVLNRKVMNDTVISDGKRSYLLKQGCNLQISHGVTHNLEEVWGPDVSEFNPRRFLKSGNRSTSDSSESLPPFTPGAYTPFGAGKHICPGRSFASGEILGFMVPVLLGFDISTWADGVLQVPDAAIPWITTPIAKPAAGSDLRARIRRRPGWEDVIWAAANAASISR